MIELFLISTEMLFVNLFLWNRCGKRRYSIFITILVYSLFRISLTVGGYFFENVYANGPFVILSGFLYIFPTFFLYETRLLKLINIFFFLWIYTFSLYAISFFSSLLLPSEISMQGFLLIQTLLYLLTFRYYYVYLIPKYTYTIDHISKFDEGWSTFLSVMWFLILFLIYSVFTLPNFGLSRLLVFVLLLLEIIITSRLIYNLVVTRIQMHQLEARLTHQMGRYDEAQRYLYELRQLSHDINKYNAVIQYALQEKKYDYLEEFYSSAFGRLNAREDLLNTGNETLDALLYSLSLQCENKKISLTLELDPTIEKAVKISPLDLTTVLGNLFENAVEACELIDQQAERWIKVVLYLENQLLHVEVTNASYKLKKDNRQGFKKLLPKHTGLANVERTVKELGGVMKHQQIDKTYQASLAVTNRNQKNSTF